MNNLNCEYVREVYPDVLRGTAPASTAAAVRHHLAGCGECRAEAELIARLQAALPPVPPGLHERIVADVATRKPARRFAPRHLALAATVAAALIGGPMLLDNLRTSQSAAPAHAGTRGLGVITVEAAMMTGTSSLQDLTVEELELLLGEIES